MQKAEHENLHQEFPVTLETLPIQLFNSNNLRKTNMALSHECIFTTFKIKQDWVAKFYNIHAKSFLKK